MSENYAVIICAKNEERTIGDIVVRCQKHAQDVVVMDGHSTDRTREIAAALGARVYLDSRRGKGEAVRSAFGRVDKEFLVLVDADGSHDPDDIPRLLRPLQQGRADHVVGSRVLGGSDEAGRDVSQSVRMFGGRVITWGINRRFKTQITESQNGLRAIRRTVALELGLREDITTIEQEMTIKTLKKGYRLIEVPTREYCRCYGSSRYSAWRVWPRYVYSWAKYMFWQ